MTLNNKRPLQPSAPLLQTVDGQRYLTYFISRQEGRADDLLNAFVPMIFAVNEFFDKVLVMADDKVLRNNYLGLLQRICVLAKRRCGFEQVGRLLAFA